MVGARCSEIIKGEFLRVAVVDDEASARCALKKLLDGLAHRCGCTIECLEYPSGAVLVANPPNDIDILFIDIEMPLINGVDAAMELRKSNDNLAIVFTTAYEEYALQSYSVQAKRYLVKPLSATNFEREIVPLIQEIVSVRNELVRVKSFDGLRVIKLRSIVYLETTPKKTVRFRKVTGTLEARGSLSDWEHCLVPKGFSRCHSGYLLNLFYVRRIEQTEVLLATGERVPLSKHRRKEFLDAFTIYVGQSI